MDKKIHQIPTTQHNNQTIQHLNTSLKVDLSGHNLTLILKDLCAKYRKIFRSSIKIVI